MAGYETRSASVIADHFSLLRALIAPGISLSAGMAQLLRQAQQQFSC
ncbi:hypothetical protein [Polaromonas sp.]